MNPRDLGVTLRMHYSDSEQPHISNNIHNANSNSNTLWMALFASYGGPYLVAAFFKIVQDCLLFLQPQLLRMLLSYVAVYQAAMERGDNELPSSLQGFFIAAVMFIAAITQTIVLNQVRYQHSKYSSSGLKFQYSFSISNDALRQVCEYARDWSPKSTKKHWSYQVMNADVPQEISLTLCPLMPLACKTFVHLV